MYSTNIQPPSSVIGSLPLINQAWGLLEALWLQTQVIYLWNTPTSHGLFIAYIYIYIYIYTHRYTHTHTHIYTYLGNKSEHIIIVNESMNTYTKCKRSRNWRRKDTVNFMINFSSCNHQYCKFTYHCQMYGGKHSARGYPKPATLKLPARHQLWTPIRSFLLECELSSHLDKSFVKQLIHGNLPIWQTTYALHISCLVPLIQHLRRSVKLDVFWDLFRLLHWKTFILQDLVHIYCTNYQT